MIKTKPKMIKQLSFNTIICSGISLILIFTMSITTSCNNIKSNILREEVKNLMISESRKKGNDLIVHDLIVVHNSGNNYTGYAECTLNDERIDLDVEIVYDGNNIVAEWVPTAEYQYKFYEEEQNKMQEIIEQEQQELQRQLNQLYNNL